MSVADWSLALEHRLAAALTRYYGESVAITLVEPLASGLTNRCLRLTDTLGGQTVWRPNSGAVDAFAIDRTREAQAQSLAAKNGLARRPIVQLPEGLLVPWVPGEPLSDLDGDHQSILIHLLARIHNLPTDLERSPVEAQCAHYETQLSASVRSRLNALKGWVLQQHPSPKGEEKVVCHMDLGAYNVVIAEDGTPCVLDWEYARVADAHLDIALFCRANGEVPDAVVEQYCMIRHIDNVSHTLARVNAWLPFTDYLALCWYEVGAKLYGLPAYKEAADALYEQLSAEGQAKA
ncbi:phosphotransferase [Salinivibrio sp. ES.052]|uniref:phosphotransferase n=1 Tax=Salinivibrio sp. ES.052 TaxID=1882823 RepID=UPI000926E118|nr:phosphotransferase [Salinivibrio sp. ES.052]SIN83251.1 thiamine kinase [Salinivibrio sp. ES.052]